MAASRRGRLSLQIKVVLAVVLIVLTPLVASAYLIDQLAKVAASFADNEAKARLGPMEKALDVYTELFQTTKTLQQEVAQRLAARPELAEPTTGGLDLLMRQEPAVHQIAVDDTTGNPIAEATRPLPGAGWILRQVEHPLADGRSLRLGFAVRDIQPDYQALNESITSAKNLASVRTALPAGYEKAFLFLLGGAALAAALFAVLAARRLTRRVNALVVAARDVSAGRVETRVALPGRDEMAELGEAFNTMLDDLDATRRQVEYLQRIGMWQEVARRLAHEIKNPLTPIQLSAERMRRKLLRGLPPGEAELLERGTHTIVQQVEAMKQMVAAFSEYAKVPELHLSELDLAALIRQVSDLYHAQDPRVAFGLSLDPKASMLEADPGRIRQLLNNLLTNSLEALDGRENPVIMIETKRAGDQIVLTVVDNGPGFQGGLLEQAFDPYVTTKPKGTGLGLAIVRRIVEEHGGQVEVDNAPQGGARIRITLPAAPRETRRAEARREKA
jgi:signal transduction histidine kinase